MTKTKKPYLSARVLRGLDSLTKRASPLTVEEFLAVEWVALRKAHTKPPRLPKVTAVQSAPFV